VALDNWYLNNIANNTEYSKNVDINTGFCNDRELSSGTYGYTGAGYGVQDSAYAPAGRVAGSNRGSYRSPQVPTLQCTNKERDLFTHTNANNGNKKLTYPIGMITMDEAIFAGGFAGTQNKSYYLCVDREYHTMTPEYYYSYSTTFSINDQGQIDWGAVAGSNYYIRPVINLKADTKFSYNSEFTKGSEADPFVVS